MPFLFCSLSLSDFSRHLVVLDNNADESDFEGWDDDDFLTDGNLGRLSLIKEDLLSFAQRQ